MMLDKFYSSHLVSKLSSRKVHQLEWFFIKDQSNPGCQCLCFACRKLSTASGSPARVFTVGGQEVTPNTHNTNNYNIGVCWRVDHRGQQACKKLHTTLHNFAQLTSSTWYDEQLDKQTFANYKLCDLGASCHLYRDLHAPGRTQYTVCKSRRLFCLCCHENTTTLTWITTCTF